MEINSEKVMDGVKLITIPSMQYKTNLVSIYIKRPLLKEEVTRNSLIPYVLRAGSQKYTTQSLMTKALQNLYGSSIGVGVSKVGERQILSFKAAYTDEKYLDEKIAGKAIEILLDMILDPYLENSIFKESYLRVEKEILEEAILSKINNKGAYAMQKMVQAMCENEPYSIPEEGYISDLEQIDSQNLYEHYKKIISESEIDVVLAGDVNKELFVELLKNKLDGFSQKVGFMQRDSHIQREDIYFQPKEVKTLIEKMNVNQGKLVLGYRTNIAVEDALYTPLSLYSVILGAGTSSKLFMNVREKHSLSYSIGAGMERMKSILFISAGIETSDFERAKELIFNEVEDMRLGNITELELANAKKFLVNGILSVSDSIWSMSDYIYSLTIQGSKDSPEEIINKINQVTLDQVVEAASKIKLDTIYYLTSNDEVKNEN